MRIAIAQLNVTVGDLGGNVARIVRFAQRARDGGADVMVTPELAICGYPPEDLLLRDDFLQACDDALAALAERVRGITLVVGHPRVDGAQRYNSASVLRDGTVVCVYDKRNLPNYTVFDEGRYFDSASAPCVFTLSGLPVGVTLGGEVDDGGRSAGNEPRVAINICADTWHADAPRAARDAGAALLLVPNASPYHVNKASVRRHVMRERIAETGLAIVYVNMVGGQDELVFDGASFVMNAEGEITHQLPAFEEALAFVDVHDGVPLPGAIAPELESEAAIYQALKLAVRDYVGKNGFPGVLLGLSGGIDSAVTLAIAVDALGADKVRAVMMPSQFTAPMSREDARAQAQALGVHYSELPIGGIFQAFLAALDGEFHGLAPDATEENLQARIRGALLMALSNKHGALVLTTGNKSEMGTGYATLYGDMAGGFGVLKDIEKTLVYRLAAYRNTISPAIPQRVIERPPSAELKADQRDEDSLPRYGELDAILQAYVHEDLSPVDIVRRGHARADVERVVNLVSQSEHKRRQAPIGVRITSRGFGKDWRYPVTNRFRHRF